MKQPKRDLASLLGLLLLCAVILLFLLVTKCQPDFFRNVTPIL